MEEALKKMAEAGRDLAEAMRAAARALHRYAAHVESGIPADFETNDSNILKVAGTPPVPRREVA